MQVGSPLKPVTVNEAGVLSEEEAEAGATPAGPQDRVTVTLAALSGTKSFCTVNPAVFSVLTIVQVPADSNALHVPEDVYPLGTGASVAVQLGSPVKPLTVNAAGALSEALADAGAAVPEAQERLTVTLAALFGTKSFCTVKFAELSVFTIVQEPALRFAAQVPVEVYPVGTGASVAVHSGSPE